MASQIEYLEGSAPQATPSSTPAPPTTGATPTAEKKDDRGGRKPRVCVSVVKGEACRTQMEGKVCPYSHEGAPAPETLTKVYICHLPLTFTTEDIQKMALPYGKIQESRVLVDPRTNQSRGVAFVHFEKHEEAEKAIKAINELKLPNHPTPLAARYARRNRAGGRRSGRRRRSRSPRGGGGRRRLRSPRRAPRRRYRDYEDEYYDDYEYDYDPYYPRRPPPRGYGPQDDPYDDYAPYGRMGGGRPGGYSSYPTPTVTNTASGGGGGGGAGYGSSQQSSVGSVDGYRSYPASGGYSSQSSGYGAPARY